MHDLSDRRTAYAAWLPRAIIDEVIELKIAAFSVAADKIAQRAAAFFYRRGKRDAHGVGQQSIAHERNAARCGRRPNARAKKALRCIDVSHADHDFARQQRLLYRDLAPAREPVHQRAGEGRRERLDAEAREQRMPEHVAGFTRMPQHRAEAPRIAKAQNELVEDPVDVVVLRCGRRMRHVTQHAQRAGHAKMHDEPPCVGFEQQILAAPLDVAHHVAAQSLREIRRNRPPQRGRADIDALDLAAGHIRFDSSSGNLYFWQLWHV